MNTPYTQIGGLNEGTAHRYPPRFRLLGYDLRLSPSEETILTAILTAEPYTPPSAVELVSLLSDGRLISKNQVSVLVGRINRKASILSGRSLIIGVSHRGYRLNPYM